ncbi:5'/3'-nucleotidase SurE [Dehalobacterium formicoaceticum]|uniref:5'-nucleotidase SurE n=1 Tax=Dehalobacterium formicoaceticum TaxID=51515 RepID=A0ABT1Y6Z0_9FIRM|nr:5'/3'-nucleotidase SurE [Dehalobacterium formicoaceticum]MCR6546323.1 5'/3'-nucleotidase SurE [Dehalobacterium formicoaceticum]
MKILITNDDGIQAEGIQALRRALSEIGTVNMVAPSYERSATGHGITVHKPIRAQKIKLKDSDQDHWSVVGTPADCVKLALETLLSEPPDLIVSGVNHGANLGTDVLYSGTVSAAIEGMINGLPSIAVSLDDDALVDFSFAADFTARLCQLLRLKGFPSQTLLNVNVPGVEAQYIQGVRVTKLGDRRYTNTIESRKDPRGREYFWLAGDVINQEGDENSDVEAVKNNFVSVSPIHFDLTNYQVIDTIKSWGFEDLISKI